MRKTLVAALLLAAALSAAASASEQFVDSKFLPVRGVPTSLDIPVQPLGVYAEPPIQDRTSRPEVLPHGYRGVAQHLVGDMALVRPLSQAYAEGIL